MEILLVLFVVWLFVTVIGHASWLAMAGLARLIGYRPGASGQPVRPASENEDIAASHRVISRLVGSGLIDVDTAGSMRAHLRDLDWGRRRENPTAEVRLDESATATSNDEIVEATLVDEPLEPLPPALSRSQLIGSFLAERNIRWGELVAGFLIVICSIGLVVSLWSTLVHTHRAIPSLIFLAANAAIYAGGFYTLARWKLRHTSRAVLVIATLLVPLSVLAGLAAAGTNADAVRLNDPITLTVITIAAAVYLSLLYRGGRALVSRSMATAMTIAVAGPVAVLPLIPAAVRTFDEKAGWIIGVGASLVAIAVLWITRRLAKPGWEEPLQRGLRSTSASLGVAGTRARLIVIGLSIFSLAVSIGYGYFATREFGSISALAIAIATVPALIAIAGATRVLMVSARGPVGSMFAAFTCVACIAASVVILLPAATSMGWIWAWAAAWSTSAVVVGRALKFSTSFALATLPVGLAAMFSSPTWLSGIPWNQVALSDRIFGSEPMLAASLVGLVSAALAWSIRPDILSRWMSRATCFWIGTASAIGIVASLNLLSQLYLAVFRDVTIMRDALVWLPVVSLSVAAIAMSLATHRIDEKERHLVNRFAWMLLAAAGTLWPIIQMVVELPLDASEQVVLATSLIASLAIGVGGYWKTMQPIAWLSAPLIGISSLVLLMEHWFEPLLMRQLAASFPVVAVALWWMIGAAALLWEARLRSREEFAFASAGLSIAGVFVLSGVFTTNWIVWTQFSALALFAWALLMRWVGRESLETFRRSTRAAIGVASGLGVTSAVIATAAIIFQWSPLMAWLGLPGFVLSIFTVAIAVIEPIRRWLWIDDEHVEIAWPVGITLLAGHCAWVAYALGWANGSTVVEVIAVISVIGAVASLARFGSACLSKQGDQRQVDFAHVAIVSIGLGSLALAGGGTVLSWLAMLAIVLAVIEVAFIEATRTPGRLLRTASRVVGWIAVIGGASVLAGPILTTNSESVIATVVIIWSASCWSIWQISRSEASPFAELTETDSLTDASSTKQGCPASPGAGLAIALFAVMAIETALTVLDGASSYPLGLVDGNSLARLAAYFAIPLVGFFFRGPVVGSANLIGMGIAGGSLLAVQSSLFFEGDLQMRWMIAIVSAGFFTAIASHALPYLARSTSRIRSVKLVQDTWQVAVLVTALAVVSSIMMIMSGQTVWVTQMTILSVAMSAWSFAVLAEASSQDRWRHVAVGLAMATIGLLASTTTTTVEHPQLEVTMRWLVAAVISIPTWLFIHPKLVGPALAERWSSAFRGGAMTGGVAAAGALIAMLLIEVGLHDNGGIDGVSMAMVIGVAITLGVLSGLAAIVAVSSGPDSKWQRILSLSDQSRRGLIIAAQAIAAITWLHVFLCKTPWATIGLRSYWPLIVMGLAFASVGVTEWARRRSDRVIADTLKQTALYLPLIPVVGFWLSGWMSDSSSIVQWAFGGGKIRYDALLLIVSVYYVGIASLWKSATSRIGAVVLANAALWVMLVQQPGWGFLAHPQIWMIPPAACVLAMAHFYRERLDGVTLSAIRYAATLVIYISSTADMLLQQIGSSLSGPVVLVLLALAGMLAGVMLRIAPFLYLGATFVFIGVTSMVWHAQRSIDAVWPWWVFGISTGILLLVGLTVLEKNKSRLKQYAQSLS